MAGNIKRALAVHSNQQNRVEVSTRDKQEKNKRKTSKEIVHDKKIGNIEIEKESERKNRE